MCYLSIYDTIIPSSAQIFIDQFKKIIKFDMLKPDPLIQLFFPDFSIKEKLLGMKKISINKSQDMNVFADMEIYIMAFVAVVIALIALGITYMLL